MRSQGAAGTDVGTQLALRRVVVGYRVVSLVWLAVLGIVVLVGGSDVRAERPGLVVATLAVATAWTVLTAVVALRAPGWLSSPAWIVADIAIAAGTIAAPALAGTRLAFYGGYPFSTVVTAVYGRGVAGAVVSAIALSAAGTARLRATGESVLAAVNNGALLYLFGAGVIAWGVEVLRRAELQRRAYEAELAGEREERRRSAERAETAAHLHDSVLQTLALLQRRSDDPAAVTSLARRQERELRDWLAGGGPPALAPLTYRGAMEDAAAEVEHDHRVAIEVVVVGDVALDDRLSALVAATREALVNAAKHAGVDRIALYAEVDGAVARAFVRDRGAGFDPESAQRDGRGVRESIIGRLDRQGGTASIRSTPGAGTEVALSLPLGPVPR